MKKILCLILILSIFIGLYPYKTYAGFDYIDYIDVKIENNKSFDERVTLYSEDGFNLYDRNDKSYELLNTDDREIYLLGDRFGDIEIYDSYGDLITTLPADKSIIIGSEDEYNSIIKVDENKYRDYITFLNNGSNLLLINHIHIENYLLGVLPREIPANSPVDALRAQAVVARSFTYTSLNKHIEQGFNLCGSTHCQVYGGYEWEHPNTNQAIIDTYGDYISYNGQIANTPYHSNSGGYTESSEKVWGGKLPYLVGVEDVYSLNSPNSAWTVELTPVELADKLSENGVDLGDVRDLQVLETSESNRVEKVRIIGSKGEETISGEKLRSMIGINSLKSTLFSVNKEGASGTKKVYIIDGIGQVPKEVNLSGMHIIDGNNRTTVNRNTSNRARGENRSTNLEGTVSVKPTRFTFEGKGYGHGVGMSQYGAIEMAKLGYNYIEIIEHYYKGVDVINLGK